MNKLVIGNLLHRPLRTLISVFAVAIEVVMILCIAAIMLGMVTDQKTRTGGVGADMIVRPPNTTFFTGVSGAPVPAKIASIIAKLPHVAVAAPVIQNLATGTAVETIWGIDYDSYNALKPFTFIEGTPFQGPNDVIIDDYYARADQGHHVGDTIQIMKHSFRVSGIVEHGKGGRKFLPIKTLGAMMGGENNASLFFVKSDDLNNQELIRQEILATPGMSQYQVQTLQEWMSLMTPEHLPGFTIALNTVITIAVIIGFMVIFQSMYTAVMERTREIGVLKSLGASKGYIVNVVLRETLLISIVGILVGIAATFAIRSGMHLRFPTFSFYLSTHWIVRGSIIALVGAVLGAAYPALKAAQKDPIDALAYE
jgi:putative ABC transport system permease protein